MKESIKNIHLAAQYLSAAGKSFLVTENDDSQSNLVWNVETKCLETRELDSAVKLTFNLENGFLSWIGTSEKLDLAKHTHEEILRWLRASSTTAGLQKPYMFSFSYELDYPEIESNYRYSFNLDQTKTIADKFTLAQMALHSFLKTNDLKSEIRVWPHHFDMGIYSNLRNELFLGAGLAIPDSVENEFYFYASGYNDGSAIETKNLPKLTVGGWHGSWNGATLTSTGVSEKAVVSFFNEVKNTFITNI